MDATSNKYPNCKIFIKISYKKSICIKAFFLDKISNESLQFKNPWKHFYAFQDYLKFNISWKKKIIPSIVLWKIKIQVASRAQFVPHLLTVCPQSGLHPSYNSSPRPEAQSGRQSKVHSF